MTSTVPKNDGVTEHVTESDYHADQGSLSASGAKLLLPPNCPARFRYEQDHPRKPKKVWDFGHMAHRILLGKGAELAVLDPDVDGLKVDGTPSDKPTATAMWRQAEADARARGAVPVHIDDYQIATEMAAKVHDHPEAGPLFHRGHAEKALYATDPDTGVRLRGRIDWLTSTQDANRERLTIVEYKTAITSNPTELVRRFWTLSYHIPAAWYIDLVIALKLDPDPDFRFVVQEKEPPYLVEVVRYDDEALAEGRRLKRRAIDLYKQCRDANEWPGYADGITEISLPYWVFNDDLELKLS